MKKAAIFDLDGTLAHTMPDITACTNKTLEHFGLEKITIQEATSFVGNGSRKLIERAMKGRLVEKLDDVLDYYVKEYTNCGHKNTTAYPGIEELLLRLQSEGVKLAVATNKPQKPSEEIIGNLYKNVRFSIIVGQTELMKVKPDKEPIEHVLASLNEKKENAVMIGDSVVDVLTAKNSEMDGISVLWGYGKESAVRDAGAVNFARDAEDLWKAMNAL